MSNKKIKNYQAIFVLTISFIFISCQSSAKTASATETVLETGAIPLPQLPAVFQSSILNPLDTPRTYIQEPCRYLKNKWSGLNAAPGTVVMIIMIKGIYNSPINEEGGITVLELDRLMRELKRQDFEAINTQQMLAFMERNIRIPPRSVMIIQDGNYPAENFTKHFGVYWQNWQWPVVNGWVSQTDLPESLWVENNILEKEGFVDHQPGGVMLDTYLSNETPKVILDRELQDPIDIFAKYFEKKPIAIIWPNGGFGQRPVTAAHQLRYQLGFTYNSRGPVMYNWVPLADEIDPQRPGLIPEGDIADPLMTLPRYSSADALMAIDSVRILGDQAAEYAQAHKEAEINYYDTVCAAAYGKIQIP